MPLLPATLKRHLRFYAVTAGSLAMVGIMVVAVSYSVTLYRLFCSATGANGTTQRVAADTVKPIDRYVIVRFDSNVAPDLPWHFRPLQRRVRVRLGEDTPVFFEAENMSDHDIVGHATFNVTPEKVGAYFKKIECFCFTEETLAAHAKVQMPVEFYVDPAMAADPSTNDVTEITLSYTFFRTKNPNDPSDMARFNGVPTPAMGAALFASQCSACHSPDVTRVGPPLRGVIGRVAGSVPGYPYTPALAHANLSWTPEQLDRWLAGPRKMVPGVAMPMQIDDPKARQAIIGYLEQISAQTPSGGS